VAEWRTLEPDHLAHAEIERQQVLDLALIEGRVAIGIEQHIAGGEQGPLAVAADRAGLERQRALVAIQAKSLQPPRRECLIAGIVVHPVAPAVETAAQAGKLAGIVAQRQWGKIREPGVFHLTAEDLSPTGEQQRGLGSRPGGRQHSDGNVLGDGPGHGGEVPPGLLECRAPGFHPAGPCQPAAG